MTRFLLTISAVALPATVFAAPTAPPPTEPLALPTLEQEAADTWQDALTGGRKWAKFRYRFESVDEDGISKDAAASTLRTVLGYESGTWNDFSILMEAEDVSEVGDDDYNSTVNDVDDRPIVADPDGTEMNQAYLQYNGIEDTVLRTGRQRIVLGNERFVGNVGWRQNEQTFDAWSASSNAIPGFQLFYAYVYNVNRIYGESSPIGDHDHQTNLLHASHEFEGVGTLDAFFYDIDNKSMDAVSTQTLGGSFGGTYDLEDLDLVYHVALANQSDAHDNDFDVDAGYMNLEVGATFENLTVKIGQELLEGSGDEGDKFTTPLATLHKFNGWADVFAGTPDEGLEDTYLSFGGTFEGTTLMAVFHDFTADHGSDDWGSEIDLLASRDFANGVNAGIKLADFDSDDDEFADTQKLWIWLTYGF